MASFLRFAAFAAVVILLLVFVALPLIGGPILGSMVRDAGFAGDDLHVDVNVVGGGIFSGRAESLHVLARNVAVPHGVVGDVDLTLEDVSAVDHSFSAVRGTLHDVQVSGPSGIPIVVGTVDLDGPAARTQARGTISASDAERLVTAAATAAGVSVDSVKLGQGNLKITSGGRTTNAQLRGGRAWSRPGWQLRCSFSRPHRSTGTWGCPSRRRRSRSTWRWTSARSPRTCLPVRTQRRTRLPPPLPDPRAVHSRRDAEVVER